MNKERVLHLADYIEKLPKVSKENPTGFTMMDFTHNCGAPACIAGWAAYLADTTDEIDVFRCGAEYLELSKREAYQLFTMDNTEIPLSSVTPEQAAKVLRHLAETDEVNWDILL